MRLMAAATRSGWSSGVKCLPALISSSEAPRAEVRRRPYGSSFWKRSAAPRPARQPRCPGPPRPATSARNRASPRRAAVLRQPAAGRGATAPGRSGCRTRTTGRPLPRSSQRCSLPPTQSRRCGRPPRVLLALLRVTRCRIPRLCSHSGVPTTSLRETTLSVSRRRAIGGAGERRGR